MLGPRGVMRTPGGAVLLMLALGLAGLAGSASAQTKDVEMTVAELVALAKKRAAFPEDRLDAIKKLGKLRDRNRVDENDVVDGLLSIVKQTDDDLFVRLGGIETLGRLQSTVYTLDRLAAKRYTEPFTKHLDDKNEEVLIRAQIAGVFGNTLVLSSLPEERALVSLQKLAEDQGNRQVGGPDEMVRQACVDAIGKIGSPKSLETLANILNQVNLSDRLKEAVVSAFYGILSRIDKDLDTLDTPPTVQKLIQLVEQTTIDPEIRAEGMKTLARLERAGVKTGNRVLPVIQKVLEKENNKVLVVAAVEALGITGKDEALDSLLKAFKDFYSEPNSKAYENDLAIRKVIAKTFAYMLSAQREKRPAPNAEAVATIAKTLISIIDPSAERKEHKDVKRSAVSSLRYLYPLTSPFKEHHKDALSRLIYLMRDVEDFKDAQDTVIETAVYLSRQDFGKDVLRWEKWFDETYPGVRVKRDTPK